MCSWNPFSLSISLLKRRVRFPRGGGVGRPEGLLRLMSAPQLCWFTPQALGKAVTQAPSPHGTEPLWPSGTSISASPQSHTIALALGLPQVLIAMLTNRQWRETGGERIKWADLLFVLQYPYPVNCLHSLAGNMCVCSAEGGGGINRDSVIKSEELSFKCAIIS